MAIPGQKPKAIEKRLKALFYGPPGSGKTTAAIQFPMPFLIDTERGAVNDEYVEMLDKARGRYLFTTNFDEVLNAVHALLTEKHEYRTLIIDPLTVIYNDMIDTSAEKNGTDFGRHKMEPDRKVKRLLNLLLRLDMNVIITSHAKEKWVRGRDAKGKDVVTQEGFTFDCYPKLDYLFDLVFELQRRGKERVGIIRKTRVKSFPEGESFEFTYDEIADRYGRKILERDAAPQVLASTDQVAELHRLIELLRVPEETIEAWLKKAEADTLAEMPEKAAQACIDWMKSKIEGKAA